MKELPLYVSKFEQLGDKGENHGAVVGYKYSMTLVIDGMPFHLMSFWGDDEILDGKLKRIKAHIRGAEIKVIK